MVQQVDTRVPDEVKAQVSRLYTGMFHEARPAFVSEAFSWAIQCFEGRYDDYLPIDARYHDFEHTLQGTLCMVRLLHGRHEAGARPRLDKDLFDLGLLAILFHDTGYLKKRDDPGGTGAKYTYTHVTRSAEFAAAFLSARGYLPDQTQAVKNMIRCTGVQTDLTHIPFQNKLEQTVGFALATADLLGQMAASDYVDKLPVLYQEFAEASRFNHAHQPNHACFGSAQDLMAKTPGFWEGYVLPRINNDFQGLYKFLNDPYPDGPNPYIDRIEKNIAKLRSRLAARGQQPTANNS